MNDLLRRLMLHLALCWVLFSTTHCDSDAEQGPELSCAGMCDCMPEESLCQCYGGNDCVVDGHEPGLTFVCEGSNRCDLQCGQQCHVECPGTSGCEARVGAGSTAVCNATSNCELHCDGDCSLDCPGVAACMVTCPAGASCEITSCSGSTQDCGDGVTACRTECP